MSYRTVLSVERTMRDMALHLVQRVLIQRLQGLGEITRSLSVEGIDAVREDEIHEVKYGGLSVAARELTL